MSDRFEQFIHHTLDKEGGFVDSPNDPGGATNFGISIRFLRLMEGSNIGNWDLDGDGDVDQDDMRLLTREQAVTLYYENFWYAELDELDVPLIAGKLFDMGVNMGKRQAGRLIQRALARFDPNIGVDGFFGPKSVLATNQHVTGGSAIHLIDDIAMTQAEFYFSLVDDQRSREVFLLGWLRRAYSLPD